MFNKIQELRDSYSQLLQKALKEGLAAVKNAKERGGYTGKYHDFPSLSFKKNGLPDFSSSFGNGPTDYRTCFSSFGGKPLINEGDIAGFGELVEFARKHPILHGRFFVETNPSVGSDIKIEIDEILITSGIKDCIERYIHNFNTFEYDDDRAHEAILPTIAYIFDENLNIEICTPILFLSFPFDEYQLADNIYIEKITEKHHLARYGVKSFNTSAHQSVVSAATHALVLKGWYVPNNDRMWYFDILTKPRAYPLELINQFFGALRISSSVETGYAQVYSIAKGWEAHCKADLPYLQGVTVRSYASWFEDYYWNIEEVPVVSAEAITKVREIFNSIVSSTENSIGLSIKRLNRCLVRDDEEDAVLDATIALEALLSDDGNQEMTHKLAMRVGALSRLDISYDRTPKQAFRDIKSIYAFRSAIVHGSKNLDKKRIIKIDEERDIATRVLAVDYLRMILRVLLENAEYREPKRIDEVLLLGDAQQCR